MATNNLDEITGSTLLEPNDFETIVDEMTSSTTDSLTLEGSLLDHMIDEYPDILHFEPTGDEIKFDFDLDWPTAFPEEKKAEERNRIRDSCVRGGIVDHPNLGAVMTELRNQDDVVIGVDDNVINDCILTSTLLHEIYAETYPNWVLISIPRLVMSQIESSAKDSFTEAGHPRVGWPTYDGRIGQRALQEVMELRKKDPDRPGLAMMTIGDFKRDWSDGDDEDWQVDALIRDQFSEFLDDIGFHKGTFFLSQNRVNVMMSGTEGSDALYLQKPEFADVHSGTVSTEEFSNLLYELCVQFGSLRIGNQGGGTESIELSIYWPGKQISDWEEKRLKIVKSGVA